MAHIHLISVAEIKSPDNKIWRFPYAFPIIISALRKTVHSFEVTDTHLHKLTSAQLIDKVRTADAEVYGISAWSHNYALVKRLAAEIRRTHPAALIICGGVISGNYQLLLEKTAVDIVVTAAEGQAVLPEILDVVDTGTLRESLPEIPGLAFRGQNGGVVHTDSKAVMTNAQFQEEDFPAYDYFEKELIELTANLNARNDMPVKGFPLLTMRGCPFSCTFCGHIYGKTHLRKKWDRFFEEIDFLISRYEISGFFSFDTNMFLNAKDVDEYCRIYESRGYSFDMVAELRTTFGDVEMFRKLRRCGVKVVLFGFESGSQYLLDRMKKGFNVEQMKQILSAAADAGIIINGNFIYGTPGENKKTIHETREFMLFLEELKIRQDREFSRSGIPFSSGYGWTILTPSPSSELYGLAISRGLIPDVEPYLLALGDEAAMEVVEGKAFKPKLAHIGGDVNMSEFPSKDSMILYVKYVFELIAFQRLAIERRYHRSLSLSVVAQGGKVISGYLSFAHRNLIDRLKFRRGFVDLEGERKFVEKHPEYRRSGLDKYLFPLLYKTRG